jgi:hypothetical protein
VLENAPDSSSLVRQPFVQRSRKLRSKSTNRPSKMVIDGRSQTSRRLRDLADQFADGLGGWPQLSELRATQVRAAAELVAIAEQLRADRLRGLPVSPDDIVRTDRLAHLAVRRLGLDRKREPAEAPNLRVYLAGLPKETAGITRAPAVPSGTAPNSEVPAPPGSPFERARVGDRVPLDDGRAIEVVDDPPDDELEPSP